MKRLKIKTFWAANAQILDDAINKFLSNIEPDDVFDIKYSTSSDKTRNTTIFSIAILYKEVENGNH